MQIEGVDIFCDNPLPQYNQGPVKAYAALPRDRSAGQCFALVCERHLIPRLRDIQSYNNVSNPSLVPLVTSGSVLWPPAKQERYVFIYKSVLGRRLLAEDDKALAMGLRNEEVMSAIIKPMVDVLSDFRDKDFFHGAIRPSNMFDTSATGRLENVVLGDCLAAPPSYGQSCLFEPIERGMVPSTARGVGTPVDDMYSFGVSLAVLLRTSDPMQGLSDQDILRQKIEFGSYAAITGKDRFKGSVLELLRGLLHDEPLQRWNIDEVRAWMDGRRLSPKQTTKHKKASRQLDFNGKKYVLAPLLALDLSSNPADTQKIVDTEDLQQWISRALEDDEIEARVTKAISQAAEKGRGPGYEDRLVSFLSTALDPFGPIRFKGLNLLGEGFGFALAEAMALKKDLKVFGEILTQGVPLVWVNTQHNPSTDISALISRFDNCRNFMRQTKIGYGIERSAYLLCQELHCLSEKLTKYCVTSAEDMIRAFEDLCQNGQAPNIFIDRHAAAFLCVRDSKIIEPFLYDMAQLEAYKKIMANLQCLAAIQKRSNLQGFPGIAASFMKQIDALYDRFHDRELRDKLDKNIRKFAADGDLVKMSASLANPDTNKKDLSNFWQAVHEYRELTVELQNLEVNLAVKERFGKSTGKQFSAVVSGAIAAIIMFVTALMYFAGYSFF